MSILKALLGISDLIEGLDLGKILILSPEHCMDPSSGHDHNLRHSCYAITNTSGSLSAHVCPYRRQLYT